jgi:putative spermidine/putrescine transport system permease protein
MHSKSSSQEQASWGLKLAAWGGLVFLHFPIAIIFLYAFNTEIIAAFTLVPIVLISIYLTTIVKRLGAFDAL